MSVWSVKSLFENVPGSASFDAKDDALNQLQCLHVLALENQATQYAGVYHVPSPAGDDKFRYAVHLATSDDLKTWKHRRQLPFLDNADMPYVYRARPAGQPLSESSWILIAHEQWMGPGLPSTGPCQLGLQLYYTDADLLNGTPFYRWTIPIGLSKTRKLEGTPNVYWAALNKRNELWSLDAVIGFHFNDENGRDVVAQGYLTQLGDPSRTSPDWQPATASAYVDSITDQGAKGNIGQRDSSVGQPNAGLFLSGRYSVQEGNIQGIPPGESTLWQAWRLWLYEWSQDDPVYWPAGRGNFYPLQPRTPNGSFAFGNPSFQILPGGPSASDGRLFVSYFLFTQGAAPGDAPGALIFSIPLVGV